MRPHDTVLELLRAANPAPELDRLDPDHLARITSLLDERRVPMTTDTNVRQPAEHVPDRPDRRPVLAFGLGLIVVLAGIGVGIWLFGGNDADDVISPSPTTAPTGITQPAPAPADTPPADAAPASPSTVAPATTIPTMTMTEGVITLTGDHGVTVSTAIDPQGRLMAAYWAENDETLKVVRCVDTGCAQPPETFTLGSIPSVTFENETVGAGRIDMVLQPNGAPIVIVEDPGRDFPTVYACLDVDCTTIESAEFTADARVDYPRIALAPDGTPRISYSQFSTVPVTLDVAVCGDLVCSADQRTTITIDDAQTRGDHSIRIDQDGRIVIGYESLLGGELAEARVAVCADDTCSDGPTILTFEGAIGARTTVGTDGDFWVWYRSGAAYGPEGQTSETAVQAAWDLMVTACNETGCADATEVEVGWGLLKAWPDDVRLAALPDGTVAAAFNYWSSELCAAPLEITVLDPAAARMGAQLGVYHLGGSTFDLVGTDRGVVSVFGAEEPGLQAVELAPGGPPVAGLGAACGE
ncbi:MAG: hypothetical protein OEO77_08330 [Acidimicrobiia bacterium]|nr:hypothetical protein [Acidimicrobiia bacterium]